jgi:hypothetical protein
MVEPLVRSSPTLPLSASLTQRRLPMEAGYFSPP